MLEFWLCFVPLFVAVDAPGVLPMFMTLVEGLERSLIRTMILQSVVTATLVVMVFIAVGKAVFRFLGITVADFMIAGGVIIFVIAMENLIVGEKPQRRVEAENLGIVPLGVPFIAGPAVITTSILLVGEFGVIPTAAAVVVNIAIAGAVFMMSEVITRVIGRNGAKALSKLASLLMAAIAVMMVRKGLIMFIRDGLTGG